tara:strand:+ start:761 stop:895 length:135 start_codon:yes stop_codon:yes gene_type:complete
MKKIIKKSTIFWTIICITTAYIGIAIAFANCPYQTNIFPMGVLL